MGDDGRVPGLRRLFAPEPPAPGADRVAQRRWVRTVQLRQQFVSEVICRNHCALREERRVAQVFIEKEIIGRSMAFRPHFVFSGWESKCVLCALMFKFTGSQS